MTLNFSSILKGYIYIGVRKFQLCIVGHFIFRLVMHGRMNNENRNVYYNNIIILLL